MQIAPQKPARFRRILRLLGPGLITGASDNDPSGVATYSQAGAKFGFGMLWTMVFVYPFMGGIQDISARVGRVTGHGIAGNLRRYYPKWLSLAIAVLMVIANTINLGADIGAMGEAVQLVSGAPAFLFAIAFAILSVVLQITVPYSRYASVLKWLTLTLFAYVAVVFAVKVPWGEALKDTLLPSVSFNSDYLTMLIALLGTTISPYLFFWQASQEVEEVEINPKAQPLKQAPQQASKQLNRIRWDTYSGMAFSNIVAFFIILTAAATLHTQGKTEIQSAAEAAQALQPIAGNFATLLFSLGVVGTGLLAIPVLAGSAAYAIGEALKIPTGLDQHPLEAKGFYAILTVATLLGLGIAVSPINSIDALFWSAVANGVVAPPVMVMLMLMTTNRRVMGQFTLSRRLQILGWMATILMTVATIGFFATWGK
ncbi:putative manganese transporter [Leptolyngbya sp. NIES-3755]|nr:putative manganese transporter [Leptolyngbya sp. NIES-3755]